MPTIVDAKLMNMKNQKTDAQIKEEKRLAIRAKIQGITPASVKALADSIERGMSK